jgi:hypothetical protein
MRGLAAGVRAGVFFAGALRSLVDFFEEAAFFVAGALRAGALSGLRLAVPGERCFDVAKR